MEVRAVAKYIRVQPRKVRIVAAHVRGKNAQQMADVLRFHPSKGAFYLRKVIVSAIANAVENNEANADNLRIAEVQVDEGPRFKRIQARAMGRANRIIKKTSHITVVVEEVEAAEAVKPHGTQAKARPTFAEKKAKGAKKDKAKEAKAKAEEAEAQAEEAEAKAEEAEVKAEEAVAEAPAEEVAEAAEGGEDKS